MLLISNVSTTYQTDASAVILHSDVPQSILFTVNCVLVWILSCARIWLTIHRKWAGQEDAYTVGNTTQYNRHWLQFSINSLLLHQCYIHCLIKCSFWNTRLYIAAKLTFVSPLLLACPPGPHWRVAVAQHQYNHWYWPPWGQSSHPEEHNETKQYYHSDEHGNNNWKVYTCYNVLNIIYLRQSVTPCS